MTRIKHKTIGLVIGTAVLGGAVVASVATNASSSHGVSNGAFVAKSQYCGFCHGASGQGYRGYYAIPRLAGQQPEYIVNQLSAFVDGRRDNHMTMRMARVHGVSPSLRLALANRFHNLNPAPFGSGPEHIKGLGKKIFEEGVPESNVPACGACHGLSAEGYGQNPRLAGQLYAYTMKNLLNWSKERGQDRSHSDPSAIMLPIVQNMTKEQIAAVASYVSTLR